MGSYKETFYLPDAKRYANIHDAMRAVLTKWETIVAKLEAGYHVGNVQADSCAFCQMFNTPSVKECKGCPIAEWSGQIGCHGTAWDSFATARRSWRGPSHDSYEELGYARIMLNEMEQVAVWLALEKISPVEKLQKAVQAAVRYRNVVIKNRGLDGVEFLAGGIGIEDIRPLLEIAKKHNADLYICKPYDADNIRVRMALLPKGDC